MKKLQSTKETAGSKIPVERIVMLRNKVRESFKLRYRVDLDDLIISDVPGYWKDKEAKMHPGHPLHKCIGCEGPFAATYTFFDPSRDLSGKFASPTRTWAILKQAT